ncbi:hypothetical protein [Streptomyces sp. ISL-100]|uniref:hypothetical protein n=1 Tax=Streptomyces sp. ISL-100 TaxID=2819173 RepID=UPI0027E4E17F|nr:hypothetical protein [Streptomyces sp. ISL-100]
MTGHSPFAGAVTDLETAMAEAPADAAGALWRLTGAQRGLDANLIRLQPAVSSRSTPNPPSMS